MVEKIDRPEIKSPYYVDSTTATKGDSHGKNQAESQSDEYSGSHAAPGWQKIYSAASNRRYIKLARENIARIWFRGTTMQRGVSLVEVDVATKDGRVVRNAHAILSAREDFWMLKKYQPGQELPMNLIVKEPYLELSIQDNSQPKTETQKTIVERKASSETGPNNKIIFISIAVVVFLLAIIVFIIMRL